MFTLLSSNQHFSVFRGLPLFWEIWIEVPPKWFCSQLSLGNDACCSHTWHVTMHWACSRLWEGLHWRTWLTLFTQPFLGFFFFFLNHRATYFLMGTLMFPRNQPGPGCLTFFVILALSLWGWEAGVTGTLLEQTVPLLVWSLTSSLGWSWARATPPDSGSGGEDFRSPTAPKGPLSCGLRKHLHPELRSGTAAADCVSQESKAQPEEPLAPQSPRRQEGVRGLVLPSLSLLNRG